MATSSLTAFLETMAGSHEGQGPLPPPASAARRGAQSWHPRRGRDGKGERWKRGSPTSLQIHLLQLILSAAILTTPPLPRHLRSPPGSCFPRKAHTPPVLIIIVCYEQGWPRAGVTQASVGTTSDGEWRGGMAPCLWQDVLPVHPPHPFPGSW